MRLASRGTLFFLTLVVLTGVAALPAAAQEGPLENTPPSGVTTDDIIQHFGAKEKEFKLARDQYTYRQSVKMQTVDGDTVDGEYYEVFDVLYDNKGKRMENVVFAPVNSLTRVGISREDLDDVRHRVPFVLTAEEIPEYSILYVGQQQEDELHCYVFDIAPKQIVGKKRYFQGRIWVDNHDFQIVKTYGKTVPDIKPGKSDEQLFPKFTTWRQQVDGQYWFPVYSRADEDLHFKSGDVHIRQIVRFEDYKRFGSSVKILYQGQEVQKAEPKPGENPQPPPAPNQNPDQKKPDTPQPPQK
jgi:hypothetical protein